MAPWIAHELSLHHIIFYCTAIQYGFYFINLIELDAAGSVLFKAFIKFNWCESNWVIVHKKFKCCWRYIQWIKSPPPHKYRAPDCDAGLTSIALGVGGNWACRRRASRPTRCGARSSTWPTASSTTATSCRTTALPSALPTRDASASGCASLAWDTRAPLGTWSSSSSSYGGSYMRLAGHDAAASHLSYGSASVSVRYAELPALLLSRRTQARRALGVSSTQSLLLHSILLLFYMTVYANIRFWLIHDTRINDRQLTCNWPTVLHFGKWPTRGPARPHLFIDYFKFAKFYLLILPCSYLKIINNPKEFGKYRWPPKLNK